MTIATRGAYRRNEPSDSSASATNGPVPTREPADHEVTVPPMAAPGSHPAPSSATASIADVVVFFASDLARYVTGAALLVDGGLFVNLQ